MATNRVERVFRAGSLGVILAVGAGLIWQPGEVWAGQRSQSSERNADPIMPPPSQPTTMTSEDPSVAGRMGQDRIEAMKMADRHNHAQKDLERMAELTSELQADFAKRGELPADFGKKAKEVEKLAHDLQTQMSH